MKEAHKDKSGYSHILKYTSMFGGVQGLILLASLVRNKFMAVLLGTGGMGLASLLVSIQNFASQCTNLGISQGAIPRLSECYERGDVEKLDYYIRVIRLWSLLAAVLGFLFCIIISPFIDEFSFTWGNHTLHFAMMGIAVSMAAISGGEMAIMKATRRLGAIAKVLVFSALAGVVASVPLYYFLFHSGIVPAIVLTAIATMLVTIAYSWRCYPFHFAFSRQMLGDGFGMIRLGIAFVLAAAVGSCTEMLIRSYLNVEGGLAEVGLYNVGYMITMTYAGMVFSAMETDFFPRLSGVCNNAEATNLTVNKQIEVSLLMLSPMLVALLAALPVLIPMLFSREFLPVVQMSQVAILAMYFKVLTMPIAYITLARKDALPYLCLEATSYAIMSWSIMVGFHYWGVFGTGVALVASHALELVIIYCYAYWRYDYRSTMAISRYAGIQLLLGVLAYTVSSACSGWCYWITEAALAIASTAYSVNILRQKTRLWEALMRKFKKVA